MILFAVLIGVISYTFFALGLLGLLSHAVISVVVFSFSITLLFTIVFRYRMTNLHQSLHALKYKFFNVIFLLGVILLLVNFLGTLGPELAFDALWYHLTLPKIYLENQTILFIPGGLLYYSAMPKLAEMLSIGLLTISSEVLVKLIHFSFGCLTILATYRLVRLFTTQKYAIIACLVLLSNLVFAWESITAYVDLVRTFFETLALYAFFLFLNRREKDYFFLSALLLGLAITTKLLAFGSLGIFLCVIFLLRHQNKKQFVIKKIDIFLYVGIAFLIPLPWFIFSLIHTGNPIYPFFTDIYRIDIFSGVFQLAAIKDLWLSFVLPADPISPMYLICIPFFLIRFRSLTKNEKFLAIYVLLAFLVLCITPRTGGGRFLLPYLPAFSALVVLVLANIQRDKQSSYISLRKWLLFAILLIAASSTMYRFAANLKYLPIVLKLQTKHDFLSRHLNFTFGDFYDTDGYFARTILPTDVILLYGFHNLYYADFPFIHESWVKPGDRFTYIAVQKGMLPDRFQSFQKVYENKVTGVRLYKPQEVSEWIY